MHYALNCGGGNNYKYYDEDNISYPLSLNVKTPYGDIPIETYIFSNSKYLEGIRGAFWQIGSQWAEAEFGLTNWELGDLKDHLFIIADLNSLDKDFRSTLVDVRRTEIRNTKEFNPIKILAQKAINDHPMI